MASALHPRERFFRQRRKSQRITDQGVLAISSKALFHCCCIWTMPGQETFYVSQALRTWLGDKSAGASESCHSCLFSLVKLGQKNHKHKPTCATLCRYLSFLYLTAWWGFLLAPGKTTARASRGRRSTNHHVSGTNWGGEKNYFRILLIQEVSLRAPLCCRSSCGERAPSYVVRCVWYKTSKQANKQTSKTTSFDDRLTVPPSPFARCLVLGSCSVYFFRENSSSGIHPVVNNELHTTNKRLTACSVRLHTRCL